jgi:alkylated DNA repair dioxygenase AlkB
MLENFPKLEMSNADVVYCKSFFSEEQSHHFLTKLSQEINWDQNPVKIFGKTFLEPRLSAYYGEKPYHYSGFTREPLPWHPILGEIKSTIELLIGTKFNAVFLNLYRDGNDGVSWHRDNQKELGLNPTIASVSFGATRRFIFRRYDDFQTKVALELGDGDLLIMAGETQTFWQHQVPKSSPRIARQLKPRINLTYRFVIN